MAHDTNIVQNKENEVKLNAENIISMIGWLILFLVVISITVVMPVCCGIHFFHVYFTTSATAAALDPLRHFLDFLLGGAFFGIAAAFVFTIFSKH